MANWCNNTVIFEGNSKAIHQINELFISMAEKQRVEDLGQLPDFVQDSDGGYFFDIVQDEGLTGIFQYETKYSPNIEAVKQIAEYFKVDFTLEYDELNWWIYGKAIFEDGILTDIRLDQQDLDSFEIDEETDTYYFEGKVYFCEYEILDTLLDRKIENHINNTNIQNNESIN